MTTNMQVKETSAEQEPNAAQEPSPYARRVRLYSWLVYMVARCIYKTLRLYVEDYEHLIPTAPSKSQGAILVTWHGRSLIPANLMRNKGYWALISLSRDGELQNGVFRRFGFQTVRGSTGRGGIRGALQMARKVREGGILAFTPDGPRGPTHKVQLGVILMAEKSGAPIIPLGVSASRRWLIGSWDSYMIPKPFSRAYFLVGEPIYASANLDEAGRQAVAAQVEIAINQLEKEAEARAGHANFPQEWRVV